MADALGTTIFHDKPAMAANSALLPASFGESWKRDLFAILRIIGGGLKTESIARAASSLPPNDPLGILLTKKMVTTLWNSMLHPPLSYKGTDHQYRSADGSGNNFLIPHLGQAGLPYAKTVQNATPMPGAKPDPGDLFDMLMARKDDEDSPTKESDLGVSSLLLYHADIIIHDIFCTNQNDSNISDTSSYLDLSPLYGRDRESQLRVRLKKGGLLKPDTFAETRLWNQPPGVQVYLILYNRYHNYVCRQLLEINENDRFAQERARPELWRPPQEWLSADEANHLTSDRLEDLWRRQVEEKLDEDLFQTARLITCGLYIQISIHDYLRCLMRKHAENTPWTLDPRLEMSVANKGSVQRGIGNQVTVEFNSLYRFHSPLSKRDDDWTKRFLQNIIRNSNDIRPKVAPAQYENGDVSIEVLGKILRETYQPPENNSIREIHLSEDDHLNEDGSRVVAREFLAKRANGSFSDHDLAGEMIRVMQDPVCPWGAQNVPKFMRSIEIMGILQARKWGMATLNEFRESFGLPRHLRFEDINSDPRITDKLRTLYGHPDMVELYPGLFCEGEGRCLDPGTSCPNDSATALWRGVFSDAVTLVRSDRFYTVDWNADTLTSWGFNEVSSNPDVFKGGVLGKLFQRALPGYFKPNSIHMWQPFYTPAMNMILAHDQGVLDDLQPVEDLGISRKELDTIMKLRNETGLLTNNITDKHDLRHWLTCKGFQSPRDCDLVDILSTKQRLNDLFSRRSAVSRLTASREADASRLLNKVCFKLLRDRVKMKIVPRAPEPLEVTSLDAMKQHFLAPSEKRAFKNPGYADDDAIPEGPLRDILTERSDMYHQGHATFKKLVDGDAQSRILDYFVNMSKEIREREQLQYQTYIGGTFKDANQLDVINDFAIPIVTRFIADLLGFGHRVKTAQACQRQYEENEIYEHFKNCQDYLSFESDATKAYAQRQKFKTSSSLLLHLAHEGVKASRRGWGEFLFGSRTFNDTSDRDYAQDSVAFVRQLGRDLSRRLSDEYHSEAAAAAMMLAIAFDAVHKTVPMFAEVLEFVLKPVPSGKARSHMENVQALAAKNDEVADRALMRLVLEAQRIGTRMPLIRQYIQKDALKATPIIRLQSDAAAHRLVDQEIYLLNTPVALNDPSIWENPYEINLNRQAPAHYLLYQPTAEGKFNAKQLSIFAVSGMIKHLGGLAFLREAHDQLGKLKRADVPAQVSRECENKFRGRFLSSKWDELSTGPSTWCLRYDGEWSGKPGAGVALPVDNSVRHFDISNVAG